MKKKVFVKFVSEPRNDIMKSVVGVACAAQAISDGHEVSVFFAGAGTRLLDPAFIKELGGFGKFLLLAAVLTFSISTMMSYSYYGSKCSGYLFGTKSIFYYRCFYIVTIVVGAMITIEVVINLVDGMYALMAIPTVVGSVLLSGKVMEEAKRYFATLN